MIQNENFIVIQGFMINDLQLKGNELLIYAIIYGFSQLENQEFNGSLQYLADWCNSTKQGVLKNLKSLIDKGLIEKKETCLNNIKFVSYYATKFNGIKQSLTGHETKFNGGIKQSLPNNINNNIYNNIYNNNISNNINNNKKERNIKERKNEGQEPGQIDPTTSMFIEFWSAYPRKVKKKDAEKSFSKIKNLDKIFPQIMSKLEEHKKSKEWQQNNGQYIPHPTTWLNQRRWEDEESQNLNANDFFNNVDLGGWGKYE